MRALALTLVLTVALGGIPLARPAVGSTQELIQALDALVKGFHGTAGVFVGDPKLPAPLYLAGADEHGITASLYKLGVLLEAERLVEAGRIRYGDDITITDDDITDDGAYEDAGTVLTLDEALERMITISDNGTALALWRLLGPENIDATLAEHGIKDFHVALNDDEDNIATARALGTYFTLLAQRKLVSGAASDRMLARLARQKINDRLPAELPEGVVVAHKTGNLIGITHDAGIIFTAQGPRVVVAMTWDADEGEATDFIAHVGSLAYAAVLEPPATARYTVPPAAVIVDAGATASPRVQVTNAGTRAWTATGAGTIGLVWEMRDATNREVARSSTPIPIGAMNPGQARVVPFPLAAPATPGDYRVTIGLADAGGVALAPLGAPTATFTLRVRAPLLAVSRAQLPRLLHRGEASLLIVQYSALANVTSPHRLALGWRVLDALTRRTIAQGSTPLGELLPSTSGTFYAPFVAPQILGTYRLDYELHDVTSGGLIAGDTASQPIEIVGARTYPDELPGISPAPQTLPTRTVAPQPRLPLPSISILPLPTIRGKTPAPTRGP